MSWIGAMLRLHVQSIPCRSSTMHRIPPALLPCLLGLCVAFPCDAATFTVTSAADDGAGSFRQAILAANAAPGMDTIAFGIGGSGVHEISVLSSLPSLNDAVLIDGYTQPGSSPNSAVIGSSAQIRVVLVGTGSASVRGLALVAGSAGSTVRGLAINRFGGSQINALSADCVITGNFIGTDATGSVAYPSAPGTRLGLSVSGDRCRIGGSARAERNVISGNSHVGIHVGGSEVVVQGNLVGTDRTGGSALGNSCGIAVGTTGTGGLPTLYARIGGLNSGAVAPRNVISGNTRCGIEIVSGEGHVIEGNLIGLAAFPIFVIPNLGPGIEVRGGDLVRIGAANAGEVSNTIAGNLGPGVLVSAGANTPQDVAMYGNSIFANEGLQIDLVSGSAGVTPNDPLDADDGPNGLQNFPVLTGVRLVPGATRILGRIDSEPGRPYYIDFYSATSCDPSGHGGSSSYLGFVTISTGAGGSSVFQADFAEGTESGFATATASRTLGGPTSEFSRCIRLGDALFTDGFDPPP
jgi:hypothetical protein